MTKRHRSTLTIALKLGLEKNSNDNVRLSEWTKKKIKDKNNKTEISLRNT